MHQNSGDLRGGRVALTRGPQDGKEEEPPLLTENHKSKKVRNSDKGGVKSQAPKESF